MIGDPDTPFAQELHRLAAVHVRQADIHDDEVDMIVARRLDARRSGLRMRQLELVVEGKLVDQRLAQIGVVVDDEDLAGCHGNLAFFAAAD